MKVVVTGTRGIPNILGGVETHCEELFPRIAQKNIDITIIRRKSYVYDSLTEFQGVKLVDIETPKKKSFEAIIHTFKAILKAKNLRGYCAYSCYRSGFVDSFCTPAEHEGGVYSPWSRL